MEHGINLQHMRQQLEHTREGRQLCDAYEELCMENANLLSRAMRAEDGLRQCSRLVQEIEEMVYGYSEHHQKAVGML